MVTACAVAISAVFGTTILLAQPPGTDPPENLFKESDEADSKSLSIDAFLFRSQTENKVMMPGLTWEELQRLIDLDNGNEVQRDTFTYQSLEIKGTANDARAKLEIVLRAAVEPTAGNWISIPLKMGNFHQLAPPDVSGVDEHDTRLMPDGLGYQLMVKTDNSSEVVLRMLVSARVEKGSRSRSLDFRLPDVPSKVELITDTKNASGEVMGRGDETTTPEIGDDGRTKFVIESSGGTFSFHWGKLIDSDRYPLLEVESRVNLRWLSPESRPIATVRTNILSLRGPVDRFQLRLPLGAVMLKPPQLDSNSQAIELGAGVADDDGIVYDVTVPEQEQQSRLSISYDIQLENQNATSRDRLNLRIPEIVGSLRHHGELEIRTSGDLRLRWRARPWIRTEPIADDVADESGRSYRFRFDRVTSDFPIWLVRKESQLRMASQLTIAIRDSMAILDMTISPGGQLTEGNLQLDEASWQLISIENLQTEQPLESYPIEQPRDLFPSGFVRAIELENDSDADPAPVRIRGKFQLDPNQDRVELPLPRVVDSGDANLVQSANVEIVNAGRSVFVVDLDATTGLRRSSTPLANTDRGQITSRFQVLNLDSPLVIIGNLVDQPLQITLSSDAKIELDGRQLHTKVDWEVSSRTDLEGRLPIRIPRLTTTPTAVANELNEAGEEIIDDEGFLFGLRWDQVDPKAVDQESPWVVTIDGVPANLRPVDDDRYELISDRLTDGTMKVRWQHVLTLGSDYNEGSIRSVSLPRPNLVDVTVEGTMNVRLEGDQKFDLVSVDSAAASNLQLEMLPRDPIGIRLKPRQMSKEDLSIRQSVVTTVVGRQTRYEQVLAQVQGGERFVVGLPESLAEVSVEGFVDSQSAVVRRDQNSLVITLPGDTNPHAVDLRVWYPQQTPSSFAMIEPTLKLPVGSGRSFWQIVATNDGHIVWTTPTLGRSMTWRFDRWNLYRTPTHSNAQLAAMIPTTHNPLPTGNRYLYVGSDLPSFQVLIVSRVMIWLIVGASVLILSALLTHLPSIRHPLTVVVAAVLFAGLLVVAPDAAVLAGQLAIISLVLVTVLVTIRTLIAPEQARRVFTTSGSVDDLNQERSARQEHAALPNSPAATTTQNLSPPSPTEASS